MISSNDSLEWLGLHLLPQAPGARKGSSQKESYMLYSKTCLTMRQKILDFFVNRNSWRYLRAAFCAEGNSCTRFYKTQIIQELKPVHPVESRTFSACPKGKVWHDPSFMLRWFFHLIRTSLHLTWAELPYIDIRKSSCHVRPITLKHSYNAGLGLLQLKTKNNVSDMAFWRLHLIFVKKKKSCI